MLLDGRKDREPDPDPGGSKPHGSGPVDYRASAVHLFIFIKISAGIALNATAKEFVPSTAEGE